MPPAAAATWPEGCLSAARTHTSSREALWRKILIAVALTAALGACKKTGEGEYQVEKPVVGTQTDTVHTPSVDVGTRTDTINTPTMGTQKDTLIVDKPVVGTKKTTVKVPTVDVKSPSQNAKKP